MKDPRDHSDETELLDVLVFLAANIRALILVPLIFSGLAYVALALLGEEHTAFYNLEFPPSVHPYIVDPIVMAAFANDSAAKPTVVDNGIRWFVEAGSEQDAVTAITAARSAALDAVSGLVAADIVAEAGGYLGLSEAGVAKQLSTVRRWAQTERREPVVVSSNVAGGIWIATLSALSFIFTILFLVGRDVVRTASLNPQGAAKIAKIRAGILGRKR
jgi:hypothetical protein